MVYSIVYRLVHGIERNGDNVSKYYANNPVLAFVTDRHDPDYHKMGLLDQQHGTSWRNGGCTVLFSGANGSYYRVYNDTQIMLIYPDDTRYEELEYMMTR
jgi:hypothetical protein